jgi:hypothetical protein
MNRWCVQREGRLALHFYTEVPMDLRSRIGPGPYVIEISEPLEVGGSCGRQAVYAQFTLAECEDALDVEAVLARCADLIDLTGKECLAVVGWCAAYDYEKACLDFESVARFGEPGQFG